ncbi:hypothetical protein BDN67DRAFT_912139, partial [Paxillus ammoniavirescens]
PFLVVTAHWISEEPNTGTLKLKSVLLAFHRIHGNHSGKSLAKTILYLLDHAKTTVKVIVPLAQEGSQLILCTLFTWGYPWHNTVCPWDSMGVRSPLLPFSPK